MSLNNNKIADLAVNGYINRKKQEKLLKESKLLNQNYNLQLDKKKELDKLKEELRDKKFVTISYTFANFIYFIMVGFLADLILLVGSLALSGSIIISTIALVLGFSSIATLEFVKEYLDLKRTFKSETKKTDLPRVERLIADLKQKMEVNSKNREELKLQEQEIDNLLKGTIETYQPLEENNELVSNPQFVKKG